MLENTCGNCGHVYGARSVLRDEAARETCPSCLETGTVAETRTKLSLVPALEIGGTIQRIREDAPMIFALPPQSTDEVVARIARERI